MSADRCPTEGCPNPVWLDGYCRLHGAKIVAGRSADEPQSLRNLIWLLAAADGFEHPRDSHGCMIWPYGRTLSGYGYLTRTFDGRRSSTNASRWLCELVWGPPPDDGQYWVAAHHCGRGLRGCVTPEHLAWKTDPDNQADRIAHDTTQHGERNTKAKLTEGDVRAILVDRRIASEIGADYGVTNATVSRIKQGKVWRRIRDQVVAEGHEVFVHKSGGKLGQPRSKADRAKLAASLELQAHKS
jgi:hypothetical protein